MNKKRNWLLFAVSLMAFMINIDYTAVNLALIPIAANLHAKVSSINWVLGAYILAWATLIVPAGKLADIYGARKICLVGLWLFFIGSIIAGLATTEYTIILGRIIQGVAGAFYVPTLYGIIFTYFPQERRGFAIGLLSLGVGLGMAIGPTFGGEILTYFGWRWIFFINIPISLLAAIIIMLCSEKMIIRSAMTLDKISSLLLMLAIVSFMYSLSQVQYWGIISLPFIGLWLFAIAMIVLFAHRQRALEYPLILGSLFKNKRYLGTTLALMCEQYSFATLIVMLGFFLQKVMNMSSLKASIMFLALTAVFGIVSPWGGKLVDKSGIRRIAFFGMIVLALATFGLATMSSETPIWLIILVLLVMGVGMGLAFSALNTGVVTTVDENEIGIASSLLLMFILIGNTLGILVSTLIYEKVVNNCLIKYVTDQLNITPSNLQLTQLNHLVVYIGSTSYHLDAFKQVYQTAILKFFPNAVNAGISFAILVSAVITLLGAAVVVLLIGEEEAQVGQCVRE